MAASKNAQARSDEPVWLTSLHLLAILCCFALTVASVFSYYALERTSSARYITLAGAGLTAMLFIVRVLVRNGAFTHAGILMHVGLFLFSCVFAVFDRGVGVLLFIPWVAISMGHLYMYLPRPGFAPTVLWCALALALLFCEKLGIISSEPWLTGIGWVNMFANVIALIVSLWWRYTMSVQRLGVAHSDNRVLKRVRAELEAQVDATMEDLSQREARFRAVSELTSDYAFGWTITPEQQIMSDWSTDAIKSVTGYAREEFEAHWREIVVPEDHGIYEQRLRRTLANETNEAEFRILCKGTDDVRWLKAYTRPIWSDREKRVVGAVGAIQDVTKKRINEDEIEKLAYYDPLTGFGNRRVWKNWADVAIAKANLSRGQLAIMYIDLDRFKAVNDTLGHDVGDALLIEVSKRIYSCLEDSDRLARLGGDEFAILLLDSGEERALTIAQCVLAQFDAPFSVRGHMIQARGSVGIAIYPRDGVQINILQQHADIAMYRAKSKAEHFQVYNPDISTYMDEQIQLEAELGAAIDSEQFVLNYQPILDMQTGEINKAEALVRWTNPKRGPVSPAIFIPLAEESGMIVDIDRWVTTAAFKQVARWLNDGIEATLSVNLSVLSLRDGDFLPFVEKLLERTGVPAQNITFEITESAAIEDPQATSRILHKLRAFGFRLAIDDFGIGYTSIVFLKQLPVDFVKIDKSFVDGIGRDSKDEGVLRAVIALAKGLEILTVAEGVESLHQMNWLAEHGCDFVQGWHVGKAMPPEQFIERTASQARQNAQALRTR
jgi:diguanylate cyclase (GGDEF)-like protein/PAS domain S-box-containing protein